MATLLVTVTHGRPKAFEILKKLVKKQTTKDFTWLIVTDSWDKYVFTPEMEVVRRTPVQGEKLPSICSNWLAALDWIDDHDEYDKIIPLEDDDWYHREYVLETSEWLDKGDLVGWEHDAYYFVLSRKAKRQHNVGHASLAATAFGRAALPWVRECASQGQVFIDLLLWQGIWAKSLTQQPPVTLANGQVVNPPAAEQNFLVKKFEGSAFLVDNFTGIRAGQPMEVRWDEKGKLQVIRHEPVLDEVGNIKDEHPRHVGLKEPWHGGTGGLSAFGHDCRQGGGPDIFGDQLRRWIGREDAKTYLSFTSDPPRNPYPAHVIVPMPIEGEGR